MNMKRCAFLFCPLARQHFASWAKRTSPPLLGQVAQVLKPHSELRKVSMNRFAFSFPRLRDSTFPRLIGTLCSRNRSTFEVICQWQKTTTVERLWGDVCTLGCLSSSRSVNLDWDWEPDLAQGRHRSHSEPALVKHLARTGRSSILRKGFGLGAMGH